jgi:high-affinity nickel-transport protein
MAALLFGALLPDWVDPIMGRVVGITLIVLGVWVFYSLYQYARHGQEFRLRSRWMLVFDSVRYGWRRLQARLHGHEHVEPVEMSSYGVRTAFGVGMIHGIGAETGTQVLIIATIGGAAGAGLGVPMMFAFILGLLISNTGIIVLSATGFVASQLRQRIYIVVGVIAGTFSLVVGALFLFQAEGALPDLESIFKFIGGS